MPKVTRRSRKINRRINSRTVANAVRAARTAPLARVRARPTIKGNGVSSASINSLRRFAFFPRKIDKEGKLEGHWWLEFLKWAGVVVMKVLGTILASEALDKLLKDHPLPIDHPLNGKLLLSAVPTGAIMRLAFGPEDFLGETDFVNTSVSPAIGHYRQARLEWMKVIINPSAHIPSRGGMIAAAIIPCNKDQMRDDYGARLAEAHDMNELLKTPGVVYKTMTTPTTLTFSPSPAQHAYQWLQFGCQNVKTGLFGAGGDCCVYLDIGIHNLSADTSDQSSNYSLTSSLLDVTIEARVHMREFDEGVYVRTGPIPLTNSNTIGMYNGTRTISTPLERVHMHHGLMLFENQDLTLDSMSI